MLHERRLETIHDVLFQRLVAALYEVKSSTRTIIVCDEETTITNSITSSLPHLPRFRCWLHSYKDIKRKLGTLGIKEREKVNEYKRDFLELLNQNSLLDYKTQQAHFYVTKWEKV